MRREKFRLGLSELYLPSYDALCGVLPEGWQPYSGLRTIYEQDLLYAKGRTAPGRIITRVHGGQSPHNYGCASDWVLFVEGQPVWDPSDECWTEYGNALEKVGLRWGADWNRNRRTDDERFLDFPHNELPIACSWMEVHRVYLEHGLDAAMALIKRSMG